MKSDLRCQTTYLLRRVHKSTIWIGERERLSSSSRLLGFAKIKWLDLPTLAAACPEALFCESASPNDACISQQSQFCHPPLIWSLAAKTAAATITSEKLPHFADRFIQTHSKPSLISHSVYVRASPAIRIFLLVFNQLTIILFRSLASSSDGQRGRYLHIYIYIPPKLE